MHTWIFYFTGKRFLMVEHVTANSPLPPQCDAVPEILKNMLLVMETTQVFHTAHGFTRLWSVTWDRVDSFLPGFRTELFKSHPPCE